MNFFWHWAGWKTAVDSDSELVLIFLLLVWLCGIGSVIKLDMIIVVVSNIINYIFCRYFINKSDDNLAFTAYSSKVFADNWNSACKDAETFISAFSVYFPAVTNISGDLPNPSYSILVERIFAIVISTIVHVIVLTFEALAMNKDSIAVKKLRLIHHIESVVNPSSTKPCVNKLVNILLNKLDINKDGTIARDQFLRFKNVMPASFNIIHSELLKQQLIVHLRQLELFMTDKVSDEIWIQFDSTKKCI